MLSWPPLLHHPHPCLRNTLKLLPLPWSGNPLLQSAPHAPQSIFHDLHVPIWQICSISRWSKSCITGLHCPSCPNATCGKTSSRFSMTQTAGLTIGPTLLVPMEVRQDHLCHAYGMWGGSEVVTSRSPQSQRQSETGLWQQLTNGSPSSQTSWFWLAGPTHGMPSTFNMSINGKDVADIIDSNDEFIEHPSAIQHVEFLPHKRTQVASRENHVLIIHFTNPTTTDCCIDCHIISWGRLLPTVKYVYHPPQCYSCH